MNASMRSMLLAAEVEQLVGLRVVRADGVEDAAGQRVGVVRHRLVADPGPATARAPGAASRRGPRRRWPRRAASSSAGVIVALSDVVRTCARRGRDRGGSRRGRVGSSSSRSQSTNASTAAVAALGGDVDALAEHRVVERRPPSRRPCGTGPRRRASSRSPSRRGTCATARPRPELRFARAASRTSPDALHPAGRAGQSMPASGANSRLSEAEEAAAEQVGVADRRSTTARRAPPRRSAARRSMASRTRRSISSSPAEPVRRLEARPRASASQAGARCVPASVRSGQRSSCSWLPASVACTG